MELRIPNCGLVTLKAEGSGAKTTKYSPLQVFARCPAFLAALRKTRHRLLSLEIAFTEQIPLVTSQNRANTYCPGQSMVEKNMKEEEESTLEERRAREQLGEGVEVRVVFRLL